MGPSQILNKHDCVNRGYYHYQKEKKKKMKKESGSYVR